MTYSISYTNFDYDICGLESNISSSKGKLIATDVAGSETAWNVHDWAMDHCTVMHHNQKLIMLPVVPHKAVAEVSE